MKITDLLNKIANGEIEDGTIFEVLGDFFYKLIVIDESLYSINTCTNKLQLVESKYIGRFINKQYDIIEIGNKIEDTPEEDKKIEKLNKHDFLNNHTLEEVDSDLYFILDKINEIIDRLNGEDNDSK